jgi:cell division septal protein FtsQ
MRALSRILVFVTVIAAMLVGVYFVAESPILRVDTVKIELADEASTGFSFPKIRETLDIRLKKFSGKQVWQIDLENIFDIAKNDLRVQKARVKRRLPNIIEVEILPHTAIANIMGPSSDRLFPMARDGEVLPPVPTVDANDAPILRGEKFISDKTLRLQALDMLLTLPEKGHVSYRHVSEVNYDKKNGFQLILSPNGIEVWLGFEDYPRRLSKAEKVAAYLTNEKMNGRVIDARYSKKVVVKLRNEP